MKPQEEIVMSKIITFNLFELVVVLISTNKYVKIMANIQKHGEKCHN